MADEPYSIPEGQAQDEDQIFILTANHTSRTVPIHKAGMTVGSKPDNDIVLDDPLVAQYHARIERGDGHYQVIDLNSVSGTFLGDLRLHAGVPVEWAPDVTLRIGENWLGLRPAGGEAVPEETVPSQALAAQNQALTAPSQALAEPGQALPEIDPNLIHWSAGKQIGVYAATEQVSIAPGNSSTVSMVLYNQGQSTDHFRLNVSGVPLSWLGSIPSVETVPAQAEQQADLLIDLPQAPTSRAGRHVVTVQVTSQEMPTEQVEVTITLTVLAYANFSCTLYPETHAPDKPAQVKIENLGNMPETFSISVNDPSGKLKIELGSEQCKIAEGESALVDLHVTPPVDLLGFEKRAYPFTLEVRSGAGQAQTFDFSVTSREMFPVWLIPILVAGILGLCGVAWALSGNLGDLWQTPTPTVAVAVGLVDTDGDGLTDVDEVLFGSDPMLADTDGDGLKDGDEQRAGTNPVTVDSDGDTLSDGQEVLVFFTSPINPDSDGDGMNDNVDPDPAHLPTATPIPPTATLVPPTATPIPPTATPIPPTVTPIPPSPTSAPPLLTDTPMPTATSAPPTATPPEVIINGWIAFVSWRDGDPEMYLYRADTRSELRLTDNSYEDRNLTWAPTDHRMAYDTNRDGNFEIYIMNSDGIVQTRLTNDPAQDSNPVWSSDGTRLAFLSDRDGNIEIYSMNTDGSDQTRLTDSPTNECCLQWSPLGNFIAFMSNPDGVWGLYRMNPDGSDQRMLALASASPPAWSPDGARLAFVSDRDGNAEIYAVNNDGTGEVRLSNNSAQDTNPVWSPNGSLIAFLSNRDGNFEVYMMNPDGSGQTRLVDSVGDECCLVWSPDGTQLAFASDVGNNYEVYVLSFDLGVVRLTDDPAYDAPLAWHP